MSQGKPIELTKANLLEAIGDAQKIMNHRYDLDPMFQVNILDMMAKQGMILDDLARKAAPGDSIRWVVLPPKAAEELIEHGRGFERCESKWYCPKSYNGTTAIGRLKPGDFLSKELISKAILEHYNNMIETKLMFFIEG